MTTQDILELLSRSIDETLTDVEQQRLNKAMAGDPHLQELRESLKENRDRIRDIPFTSPELDSSAFLKVATSNPWRIRLLWIVPVAAALVLAFALNLEKKSGPTIEEESSIELLQEHIDATRLAFKAAINSLESRAENRLQQLPPHLQVTFQQNLTAIDQAIASCETMLPKARMPDGSPSLLAYQSLSQAYEAKLKLLEQILKT